MVHDLTNYLGRFSYFYEMTDPSTLLYSNGEVLEAAKDIENADNKRIVDAAIHPATGDIIPRPFRVAALAPFNMPLIFAMLITPATNVPVTLFLHWFNQSLNTTVNYFNRAGAAVSWEKTAVAYSLAVSSACTIAFGMGKIASRIPMLAGFPSVIPVVATAAASCSNLAFTRSDELFTGATVVDDTGKEHGKSVIVGKQGIAQTALSRCVLVPIACVVLPDQTMSLIKRSKVFTRSPLNNKFGVIGLQLAVIYSCFRVALPATLAIFPPTAQFVPTDLEPQFHSLKDVNGNPVTRLFANKGL